MGVLYVRNVPEDVGRRLADLAAREGMSVASFALRELTEASRRADNGALLGDLPDHAIEPAEVVEGMRSSRDAR